MPTASLPILEYWFAAKREQVGIVVTSNNRQRFMNQLYAARREYPDPRELEDLSICVSPTNETELWIVHKTIHLEGPTE
jgi:hypothetical protein